MKLFTKRNAIASALALTGLFVFAGSAQADTVQADYLSYTGGQASGFVNNVAQGGGGGLFKFQRTGGDSPLVLLGGTSDQEFIGICLEFTEFLDPGNRLYNLIDLADAPVDANNSPYAPMGATRANDLATLLGGVYSVFGQTTIGGVAINSTNALALQIAVWEISMEGIDAPSPSDDGYDLSGGYIKFNNSDAKTLAQSWLDKINTGNSGWTALTNLRAISVDGQQDFVVQVVPIPAAAWLFGSAILGVVALGRRKQKEGAEA